MAFLQEYTMLDELGKGGFATVYKVRHNELGYIRAVRVLNETIVDASSKTYQKFLRECRILLRLGNGNHPNIVHIYQPRLLDNKALVEMDYVDGQDLVHYLKQERDFVPAGEVIRMATQMSSALAYCHEDIYRFCMDRNNDGLQDDPNDGSKVLVDEPTRKQLIQKYKVIHNDIHSGNIMRREDGNFVLLDFGLAINGDEVVRSSRHANGAPEFKAPEKWDDDTILSEQSDIYSFGIVMFQYLAGRVPFPYNTRISNHRAEFELAEAHLKTPPPSIEAIRKEFYERKYEGKRYERDYPQWLEEVILKCLRKNPVERFKNGKELYDFIVEHANKNNEVFNSVELDRLTTANRELAAEVNDLRHTNSSLASQLDASQNALNQSRQSLQDANAQLKQLQSGKRKKSPLLVVLLVLFGLWGGGMTAFWWVKQKPFMDGLDTTVSKLQEQNSGAENEGTVIVSTDGASASESQLQQQLTSAQQEIQKLQAQLKNVPSGSSSSDETAKLKRQLQEKEQTISNLKKELNTANSNISTLNKKLEQANKEIKALQKYN